jgi:NAD(P)H-nitrite reductase large subunit
MNYSRLKQDPTLICTCNDLDRDTIQDAINAGCEDAEEIMFDQATFFRCAECKPRIELMIKKFRVKT